MRKNPSTTDSDERDWTDLTRHARAEGWWEWLIIAALIFEAALLWIFGCGKSVAEKLLNSIATLAIAAGVYGALRSGGRASAAGERLQRRSTKRVREANERAAEAEARASEAKREAEEVRLELEKVRLEFAKYKAARKLDADQHNRISDGLRQFAGVKYVGAVSWVHPEFMPLLANIEDVLDDAGWIEVEYPAPSVPNPRAERPRICIGAQNTGVQVLIRTSVRPPAPELESLKDAGLALANALTTEGVETTLEVRIVEPVPEIPAITMHVMIGPK